MIHISDIAQRLEKFLISKNENNFKIFIRINFCIDVFIATDQEDANNYENEFLCKIKGNVESSNDYYYTLSDSLRINFKILDLESATDSFYENLFSNLDEHIEWGPRYRFDSLLCKKNSNPTNSGKEQKTPIITFYSYKGGMGRTTTMVAYALSLATNVDEKKRKKVVIIDCDLEAPGYLNFFDLSNHRGLNSGKKNGLVEFISDAQFTLQPDKLNINDYIINVGLDNENSFIYNNLDSIWIVPAGNLNENYTDIESNSDRSDYLEGLAKINLSNVNSVIEYFGILIDKINETIDPDIILLDSRTGFNDIFGTVALYLSSCVVAFFGFSRQTQPGLINLLREYYSPSNVFSLNLVFSILPEDVSGEWIDDHKSKITAYINHIGNEKREYPAFLYLHRNFLLEKIGTGDEQSDSEFVKLVQSKKFDDYNILFDRLNNAYFKEEDTPHAVPVLQLRNTVLKELKDALTNVRNFAEDTQIEEEQFFYRECMKELFDPQKFLIQGYKGTGKTYLYKALGDKKIASNVQVWASSKDLGNVENNDNKLETIFINILPPEDTSLVFNNIRYSSIEEPEYYFDAFWQIYTWNAILLYPEFQTIKEESDLAEYIQPITGANYAKEALVRFNELIEKGVKTLLSIEKDISKLNELLVSTNRRLFVLYDRLDTCINPLRWNKAVSPLINYWRNNCQTFSNIVPKVFVRTDLFKQIEGTNTARLESSIIHIEWSLGEVFGYFFKLIFSRPKASKAYWEIADRVGMDRSYISNTRKSFERFPKNQFKSLTQAEMSPIIRVFFGSQVNVHDAKLGNPWDYFGKELANADNTAISLRPFINTMDSNAVDKALVQADRHVKALISPEIYASKEVRETTTERYFADLTQDAFSKDLLRFREIIRAAGGKPYRYKSLTERQFEELLSQTFERIVNSGGSEVVKTVEDLKRLIFANGIMAERITKDGRYFTFAPIYWYSWGLENSDREKKEKKKLVDGGSYDGVVLLPSNPKGQKKVRIPGIYYKIDIDEDEESYQQLNGGDWVTFTVRREDNWYNKSQDYWIAFNVRLKED